MLKVFLATVVALQAIAFTCYSYTVSINAFILPLIHVLLLYEVNILYIQIECRFCLIENTGTLMLYAVLNRTMATICRIG